MLECLLITGQDADYQLKVIVRDMEAYQACLLNKITRIEGVSGSAFRALSCARWIRRQPCRWHDLRQAWVT